MTDTIGSLFPMVEAGVAEVISSLGTYTLAMNDPPWTTVRDRVKPPQCVVHAFDMELTALEALVDPFDTSEVVVGLGGGTALDTAKFLAWRGNKRLIQIPTITSVDAGFTDAIGVREGGKVRYIGKITPEMVVLDIPLIRSAPRYLNRGGIGDILSCHTGLHDWRLASEAGSGVPWRDDLAALGRTLLGELDSAAEEIHDVTSDGVRFMASAYRRIGAACAEANHSRFEEGSEHFWAYCYEHATGAHQVHGELIALGVAAMSVIQGNDPAWVQSLIRRCATRCHPQALGISREEFIDALVGLRAYARAEGLDVSVVDVADIDASLAGRAWDAADSLPKAVD
ncbi:MAG: iron-containing alcohol dehydrogenase [Ilumatobacteraceae bacterium]